MISQTMAVWNLPFHTSLPAWQEKGTKLFTKGWLISGFHAEQ